MSVFSLKAKRMPVLKTFTITGSPCMYIISITSRQLPFKHHTNDLFAT